MVHITKIVNIATYFAGFLNREIKVVLFFLLCFSLLGSALGQSPGLFDSDEERTLNLRGDLRSVFKDRGDDPQYHSATLQYKADLNTINIPIKIKTRGHFRKISTNCKYPPIFLNFKKSAIPKNSVFEGQDKVKLVTPCQGDKYVLYEYLVYKSYNLITPRSFNARLIKVVFQDTVKNKSAKPYYRNEPVHSGI